MRARTGAVAADRREDRIRELFGEHHAALERYLERLTGDPEVAADAAQEAFVRLVTRADGIPPAPGAWLFRVATNHARDHARTRRRRGRLSFDGRAAGAHGDGAEAPDRMLARARAARRLRAALDGLSPKERQALLMREEGFLHREIAEALDTTTGSVGTLLRRALEKAAAALGPPPEDLP